MGRKLFVPLLILAAALTAYIWLVVFQERTESSSSAIYSQEFNTRRPVPQDNVMHFEIARLQKIRHGEESWGTAFSIDGGSKWLTARHVVAPCMAGNFRGEIGSVAVLDVRLSEENDLALVTTEPARVEPMGPLRLKAAGKTDQAGYLIGYPGAKLAEISVRWIGPGSARQGYPPFRKQTVSVWSEASRVPMGYYDLRGMSGSALMAADGSVIGVLSAVLPRRGRLLIAQIDRFAAQSARPTRRHPALPAKQISMRESARLEASRGTIAEIHCSGL